MHFLFALLFALGAAIAAVRQPLPEGRARTAYENPEIDIVAGTTADTNIAVAGITKDDVLIEVLEIDIAGNGVADRTAEASITSAGNIQLGTTDTTASHLVVKWANMPS